MYEVAYKLRARAAYNIRMVQNPTQNYQCEFVLFAPEVGRTIMLQSIAGRTRWLKNNICICRYKFKILLYSGALSSIQL